MTQQENGLRENNRKELFDQFKFHLIYKNKKRKVTHPLNDDYKDILGKLGEEVRVKRARIKALKDQINHHTVVEKRRPNTSFQTRVWKARPIEDNSLQILKQNLIVIETEKQNLKESIHNLQSSLADLKKDVAGIRKSVDISTSKIQKYKHASFLSNSIQRHTDTVKIINNRYFRQLVRHHDETLSSLKEYKCSLREENEELETKCIQHKKSASQNKRTFHCEKPSNYDMGNFKIDKRFVNSLQELLEMFMQKQKEFDQIKVQETTKIRLKRIQKQYLKEDRVKLHDMIDRFEERYEIKIESLPNLISFIYKKLSTGNVEIENECIKLNHLKQLLIEDLDHLNQKKGIIDTDVNQKHQVKEESEQQAKVDKVFKNSQILVKVASLFHNLIGKFRYLFTMAITLRKEKKSFHDLLVQIGNIYNQNSILSDQKSEDTTNLESTVTNFREVQEILQEGANSGEIWKIQLLTFIFSDLRYTFIFRRGWFESYFKQGIQLGSILEKVESIQTKCEQIYDQKIKVYSLVLINCLKALAMNKYEKKMVAGSRARQSLFINIPKSMHIVNMQQSFEDQSFTEMENKTPDNKLMCEQSQQNAKMFEFSVDPVKIVHVLEKIRNEEKKRFKSLHNNKDQVYMYDSKVVLPKYIF